MNARRLVRLVAALLFPLGAGASLAQPITEFPVPLFQGIFAVSPQSILRRSL